MAYPLSDRQLEELMQERGVAVDHATINRWVLKSSPQLEETFHHRKRPVWMSWHLDETYSKIKGRWHYLYRAVDKSGQTVDFLLTPRRDCQAALRFLTKAIRRHGVPEKITIDGSEANDAAIRGYNEAHGTTIAIRQVRYLNNVVEQDHRAVKRLTCPMLGFKSFEAAPCTLAGVELMHMIRKGQLASGAEQTSPQLHSSTPWRPNHLPSRAFCVIAQHLRHIRSLSYRAIVIEACIVKEFAQKLPGSRCRRPPGCYSPPGSSRR